LANTQQASESFIGSALRHRAKSRTRFSSPFCRSIETGVNGWHKKNSRETMNRSLDSLHIGLIGCGAWGKHILRDLISLRCRVSVVARSTASRARAQQGGATTIFGEISSLRDVDGIIVCTPLSTHFDVISEVLDRFPPTPVFSEKCLTKNLDDAASLARRAPERLFVMDKWRYHPGIKKLAAIARSNEFGMVVGIRTLKLGWGNPHPDADAIWTHLPHDLSIVLEILGLIPEPVSAAADLLGATACGLTGVLGHEPWSICEVSARSAVDQREVRLYLEQGVAILPNSYSDCLQVIRTDAASFPKEPQVETRAISQEMPLRAELAAFVDYLAANGPPPKSSVAEGRQIVETIVALRALAGIPMD
jgi:predicted dehydrogenase